ncbi:MAG: hypothetical protein LBT89_01830 [Planctomycetaceae bacterium]|jgi:hypothetical protein|nr:hypothetical protein [Planctomycetaceae bacterium]
MKDRIVDFRRIPAKELRMNPKNWRTHNHKQRQILKGLLSEIGIGSRFMEAVGGLYLQRGCRFSITGTHRSIIEHCKRSSRWQLIGIKKLKKGRAAASFILIDN